MAEETDDFLRIDGDRKSSVVFIEGTFLVKEFGGLSRWCGEMGEKDLIDWS